MILEDYPTDKVRLEPFLLILNLSIGKTSTSSTPGRNHRPHSQQGLPATDTSHLKGNRNTNWEMQCLSFSESCELIVRCWGERKEPSSISRATPPHTRLSAQ